MGFSTQEHWSGVPSPSPKGFPGGVYIEQKWLVVKRVHHDMHAQ